MFLSGAKRTKLAILVSFSMSSSVADTAASALTRSKVRPGHGDARRYISTHLGQGQRPHSQGMTIESGEEDGWLMLWHLLLVIV